MDSEELKFKKEDCMVSGTLVDHNKGKRPPRWGVQAGNVINGVTGPAISSDLNAVTVTHIPTGISATEHRHIPYRNKEIAFIKVEALVNELIEQIKAANAKAEEGGV